MKFITKLNLITDKDLILEDMNKILSMTSWEPGNQIGLRHRKGCENQWKDGIGSLYNRSTNEKNLDEKEFNTYNDNLPNNLKSELEKLQQFIGKDLGRARLMKLDPKTGLSIHLDEQVRYHLALKTDKNAIFAECLENNIIKSIGYNIPADSFWYLADTTKFHYVYNGGWEPRIHLVVCPT